MKKNAIISTILAGVVCVGMLTSCGGQTKGFNNKEMITVVSREDGSGTRGAFIELMEIQEKTSDGKKIDKTTKEAVIANNTEVMLKNVAGDAYAIGYTSLGSLNDSVKAVKVDGALASPETVKSGTYKVSRPFNIAVKETVTPATQDFIDYMLSAEGQKIVSKGYITINDSAPAYAPKSVSGKIVVVGSSSVNPVMEKLKEGYVALNPAVTIEIQANDSTAGITAAESGTCDIGMASRELKDSEKAKLKDIAIALDGIAIITNNENPITEITSDLVKSIFTGEVTTWSEVK